MSGISLTSLFPEFYGTFNLIYGKKDFGGYLKQAFDFWSWKYEAVSSEKIIFRYGIKATWITGSFKISSILEGSSSDLSGLVVGDKIHSVNGYKLNNDINQWLDYFSGQEIVLSFERAGVLKRIILKEINETQYYSYKMIK